MKLGVFLGFFQFQALCLPQTYPALKLEEMNHLKAISAQQIIPGFLPDKAQLSCSGSYLISKFYDLDPSNPQLMIFEIQSKKSQIVQKPDGFLDAPLMYDLGRTKKIYAYLEPKNKQRSKGIYLLNLEEPIPTWKLVASNLGFINSLSINRDGTKLLFKKSSPMPGAEEKLFMVDLNQPQTLTPLAINIKSQIENPQFSQDGNSILFTKRSQFLDHLSLGQVYRASLVANSIAEPLKNEKLKSIHTVQTKGIVVQKKGLDHEFSLIGEKNVFLLRCPQGLQCKILGFGEKNKFYFSVRNIKPEMFFTKSAAVFEGSF